MCIHVHFNSQKATQALVYFVAQEGGRMNKMKALKLIYFADRYHLRKYGSPITNDEYFAMPYGPVASGVKDIAEFSDFLGEQERLYALQFLKKVIAYEIGLVKSLEPDVLSQTDIEALSFAWKTFGKYNEFDLSMATHKYPDWKKHEKSIERYGRIKMDLEDFLEDPVEPDMERCVPLSDQEKRDTLDELRERAQLDGLWN
ncbi:hypothetical protein CSB45_14730 [candidate division KSB3 bacterium]|uniref:Antitoxin SocA-like Panacea domain-containing protein n=1 Tax=candidate division KSB3 bacterium TaxID=2044937 RepID=A0A2G6E0U4_9BACT|nr:MAG: hypothetical protein CSB45_14730 [candidate division KSB3 bacterium]